jgi:hypothetical protein
MMSFISQLNSGTTSSRHCLLLQDLIQSCASGGRRIVENMCHEWRTCAMRYDEPRLVWTRLTTSLEFRV